MELEGFYATVIYWRGKKTEKKYTSKKLAMHKAN